MLENVELSPEENEVVINSAGLDGLNGISWNEALKRVSGSRIQQTVHGAKIRWNMDGQKPYFLTARRNGEDIGQLYLHRGFVHPDLMQWGPSLLKWDILHRLWGIISWFGGPVIYQPDDYEEVLRAFLSQVDLLIEQNGITAVKNATPAFYEKKLDWHVTNAIYREYGYDVKQRATIYLDIEDNLDGLWSGLSREARQKVRKAERLGVEVTEENSIQGLEDYYTVRQENARRNGLRAPSRASILASEPVYMSDGLAKLFLAKYQGEVIAGQLLVVFNGNVQLGGISYSDRSRQLRLPANDALQWAVIRWALESGQRRIDWAGYTPEPKSEKEKGINRFKEKWGGQVIRYNVYDKIIASKRFMGLDWVKSQLRRFDIR